MFYSGLPDFKTFQVLFESLMEHDADNLCTEPVGEMNMDSLERKRKLRRVDEFMLVMMRLSLDLLLKDLEFRFKITATTISLIYTLRHFHAICVNRLSTDVCLYIKKSFYTDLYF